MKSLSALLKGITSNHKGDFYFLTVFIHRAQKKNSKNMKKHVNCFVEIPNDDEKILKYNYGEKSLKLPAIIYADLECLLEKMHSCQNNPEKSYTEKKISIHFLVTHCLQIVRLIQQGKTVWKGIVKI